jgi:hypothetical protein
LTARPVERLQKLLLGAHSGIRSAVGKQESALDAKQLGGDTNALHAGPTVSGEVRSILPAMMRIGVTARERTSRRL